MLQQTPDQQFLTELNAARYDLAFEAVRVRAVQFLSLLRKAGFRPDQLRVPAGNPDGGQWTEEGVDRSYIEDNFPLILISEGDPLPPKIPDKEPPTPRLRNQVAVGVATYLYVTNTAVQAFRLEPGCTTMPARASLHISMSRNCCTNSTKRLQTRCRGTKFITSSSRRQRGRTGSQKSR